MQAPKGSSSKFDMTKVIAEDNYKAILIHIIDVGTQTVSTPKFGEQKKRTIIFGFEIPTVKIEREGVEYPLVLSSKYTFSMYKQSLLRKVVEGILGKKLSDEDAEKFDFSSLIGKGCMVQIVHNSGYANINTIISLGKSEKIEQPENECILFSMDEFAPNKFEQLPDRQKKIIMASDEWSSKQEQDLDFDPGA